jgi:hypothetical protein
MPWLGFTFAKKPVASSAAPKKKPSASSAPSPSDVAEAFDDGFEAGTDEAPTVRMLRPEEIEKLQSENEQLKALIQQLSEKAKVQMQQPQAGVYPSVDGASSSSAASSSSTASPILTPSAPSAPSSFAFTKITDVHNVLSSPTPSAPPAELSASRRASSTGAIHSATALTPAELAPVSDFYDSLRKSLAASNSASSTSSSSPVIVPKPAKADADFEESEEDEWGAGEKTEKKPAAIVQESVNAPRTEDEAIVHNKHSSVIIRKKPIRQPKDEEAGSNTTTTAAAPKTTGGDLDDFDDDFGMMDTAAASSATALDEPEEEIAVFDVSQADWWYVVRQ